MYLKIILMSQLNEENKKNDEIAKRRGWNETRKFVMPELKKSVDQGLRRIANQSKQKRM